MRNIKYALVCLGVLLALTGCGTETEDNMQSTEPATTAAVAEADGGSESDAETEAKTESETETDTESETKQTEVSETDAESATETSSSETDNQNADAPATSVSQNNVTVTETEQPQAQTPSENTPVQTDTPVQEPVQTDPPVQPDAPTEPEPDITEPPATDAPVSGDMNDLKITYQGQTLAIGDNAESFVKAVKPNFEESAPSCYGNGENINYYYDDITVYVWNENNNYMVYSIDVNAPNVAPAKGYDIGSAADFEGQKIIDCGDDCNIVIAEAGGQVVNISYNKNL